MYDFVVGMMVGSLLTILPLLVWDRMARSRAESSTSAGGGIRLHQDRGDPTDR